MELIRSQYGMVAIHVSSDDVCPPNGILQTDLARFIGDTYQFSGRPNFPPNASPDVIPILVFQAGKLIAEGEEYLIHQLSIHPNGDVVTATTTDAAEIILADYIQRIETSLGFSYGGKRQRKSYLSGLVVQFEDAAESKLAALGEIGRLLTGAMPRDFGPFELKTVTFGYGDPMPAGGDIIEYLGRADATLQRRVGEPYSENRYFSAMPLPTQKHLELLQKIEAALK